MLGFISPLLILFLTVLMLGFSSSFHIGLIVEDKGAYGFEMASMIKSNPAWDVVSENADEARRLYDSG